MQFSWKAVPQLRTCSCKTLVSIVAVGSSRNTRLWRGRMQLTESNWQSAADKLEPCRTVTGRPGWPSWNPPDVEPEASAAAVALAWCGRNVECPTPNLQSGQTADGSSDLRWCNKTVSCSSPGDTKWTPGPASLWPRLTWIGRAVGAGLDWSEQCFTSPPTQYRSCRSC